LFTVTCQKNCVVERNREICKAR